MSELDDATAAFMRADAAGDTASAQLLADHVRALQAQQAAPVPPAQPTTPQGHDLGGLEAAGNAALDTASFGGLSSLSDKAAAALGSIKSHLTPGEPSQSYQQELQKVQANNAATEAAHPYARLAGGAAGIGAGAALMGPVLGAAEAVPYVGRVVQAAAPVAGQPWTNVAKSAAVNAGIGGGVATTEGQPLPQAAQTAAISGVAGPVVGKLFDMALHGLAGASSKAYMKLADLAGEPVDALKARVGAYRANTGGRNPSLAEILPLKAQGNVGLLAQNNPTVGEATIKAAQPGLMTPDEASALTAAQGGVRPSTPEGLSALRGANMTSSMAPIRGTPVDVRGPVAQVLRDPAVTSALKTDLAATNEQSQFNDAGALLDKIQNNQMTLGDLDAVRQLLRSKQATVFNSVGKSTADQYGKAAQAVEDIGAQLSPAYGNALEQFRGDSRYIEGFKHGMTGQPIAAASTGVNPQAVVAPEGGVAVQPAPDITQNPDFQGGFNHGNQLYQGQRALKAIAPASVSEGSGMDASHAAQAAAAVGTFPSPWFLSHALRSISSGTTAMSEKAQAIVAKQLLDPTMTEQAIANMHRAGLTSQQMRQISAYAGNVTSAKVAKILSQGGQQ